MDHIDNINTNLILDTIFFEYYFAFGLARYFSLFGVYSSRGCVFFDIPQTNGNSSPRIVGLIKFHVQLHNYRFRSIRA